MKRLAVSIGVRVLLLGAAAAWMACLPAWTRAEEQKKRAIVAFDLVSKYDDGNLGQKLGDMVAAKLKRETSVLITEMVDVRDLCANSGIKITPETSLDKVKEAVRGTFDADVGIWGEVELAPGQEKEIYDITLKCYDFSSSAEPTLIYEKTARTNSAAEIPHLYVKEMLDKLLDRKPGGPATVDPVAEENWKNGPNLVVGGDFESAIRGVPKGWEARAGQNREPLGRVVAWLPEAGNPKNHVIRFTLDRGTAEGTGVMYYSEYFPIKEGATYRFQCRYRTNGPSPKVFIKCADDVDTTYSEGLTGTAPASRTPAARTRPAAHQYIPQVAQRREVYRSQQNLKGPLNTWNTQTQDFTPKHTKYTPKWGRVDLYAYLSPGVVEWDDVVIKELVTASEGDVKIKRHSLETKVTIKEMEENEARGKESRERLKKDE